MGVYQSIFLNQVTFPAMVHTSVDLAKKRGHIGMANLVNAVLKRVPQTLDGLVFPDKEKEFVRHVGIRYSLPNWLVQRWQNELGRDECESLALALNCEAPIALRVNRRLSNLKDVQNHLEKNGCAVEKRTVVPEELTVVSGDPLHTKGFERGWFTVQDPASMLAAHLLEPMEPCRVLDLCAAPGSKTTHLAERAPDQVPIVACDIHPGKADLIRQAAERLQLGNIHVFCGDGARPAVRGSFDRILVDAPCTGLGTLRRRPDLKWRVQPEDPMKLAELQIALLRSAIQLCENNGLIVYSVCTTTPEETDQVLQTVVSSEPVVPEDGPDWLHPWKTKTGTYRLSPHREPMDGFFLTRLRKSSSV
ncbi:MAG: ribosomal RNA small subunit methyltransferase B [Candidatus Hydrogenedentota bacterium]